MKVGIKKKSVITIIAMIAVGSAQASLFDNLVGYYDFEETGSAGLANKAPGATGGDAAWIGTQTLSATGFGGDATFNPGDGLSDRSTLLAGNALNIVDGENSKVVVPYGTTELAFRMATSKIPNWLPSSTRGTT